MAHGYLGALSRRIFTLQGMKRFDENCEVLGPTIDLYSRAWPQEANEEMIDLLMYLVLELEKRNRRL